MQQNDPRIVVDERDKHVLEKRRWFLHEGPRPYVYTHIGRGNKVYLHRLLLNAPAGYDVDHIDGNPLNNRRDNLRLCTRSQNLAAKRRGKRSKTGYRGVYQTPSGKYVAKVLSDSRKQRHLGTFVTAEEAATAYNAAALEKWGEFAVLNKLENIPQVSDVATDKPR